MFFPDLVLSISLSCSVLSSMLWPGKDTRLAAAEPLFFCLITGSSHYMKTAAFLGGKAVQALNCFIFDFDFLVPGTRLWCDD